MKPFIAIDHTVPEHHKHQEFDTLEEAQAHVNDNLPNGFATTNPGGKAEYWIVDDVAQTVTYDDAADTAATVQRQWNVEVSATDATMPRWFEDYLDENSINLAPGRTKDNFDNKKNIRSKKP